MQLKKSKIIAKLDIEFPDKLWGGPYSGFYVSGQSVYLFSQYGFIEFYQVPTKQKTRIDLNQYQLGSPIWFDIVSENEFLVLFANLPNVQIPLDLLERLVQDFLLLAKSGSNAIPDKIVFNKRSRWLNAKSKVSEGFTFYLARFDKEGNLIGKTTLSNLFYKYLNVSINNNLIFLQHSPSSSFLFKEFSINGQFLREFGMIPNELSYLRPLCSQFSIDNAGKFWIGLSASPDLLVFDINGNFLYKVSSSFQAEEPIKEIQRILENTVIVMKNAYKVSVDLVVSHELLIHLLCTKRSQAPNIGAGIEFISLDGTLEFRMKLENPVRKLFCSRENLYMMEITNTVNIVEYSICP